MDKYLLQILHDVNTIIIPGLGALTVTNAKTGEIMFMSYLKYDDGKLAAYISEKEGMSINDAKNLIAKYVRDIQAKLDQGNTYDMFQFGRFLKTRDGEIDFENWGTYKETEEPENAENSNPDPTENPEPTNDPGPIAPEPAVYDLTSGDFIQKEDSLETAAPEETATANTAESLPQTPATDETSGQEAQEPEIFEDIGIPTDKNIYLAPETSIPNMETKPVDEPKISAEHDQVIEDFPVTTPSPAISLEDILGQSEQPAAKPKPIALPTQDESKVQVENIYIPPVEKPAAVETPVPPVTPPSPAPPVEKPVTPVEKPASKPIVSEKSISKDDLKKQDETDSEIPELRVNWTPAEAKPKRKRGPVFWILMILIILLIAGGVTTALFYDQVKTYIPFLENKRAEAAQKTDTVASAEKLNASAEALEAAEKERVNAENQAPEAQPAEPETVPAPVEKPAVQEPAAPAKKVPVPAPALNGNKPYHVIVGAFGSKANADRYAEKLRTGGNSNGVVLGQYDKLYLVSIDSYSTNAEAKNAISSFTDIKGNKWVFKKK